MSIKYVTPLIYLVCNGVFGAACFDEAAERYQQNADILRAISWHESKFNRLATNLKNKNGTRDVCHMQVNSSHFPELEPLGITESMLYKRPCVCTEVGAWVLAQCVKKFGNTWEAVGCYNAGPASGPKRRAARLHYAEQIRSAYQKLTSDNTP